jgi:hypothetical protein
MDDGMAPSDKEPAIVRGAEMEPPPSPAATNRRMALPKRTYA